MAETWLMGCQNLSGGDQSHLEVAQGSDIAARGCNVATYQPMKLRQSGRFKVRDQFAKFRVHQILLGWFLRSYHRRGSEPPLIASG
jgi:hypothetical protein